LKTGGKISIRGETREIDELTRENNKTSFVKGTEHSFYE
jgi:hypothetical protein